MWTGFVLILSGCTEQSAATESAPALTSDTDRFRPHIVLGNNEDEDEIPLQLWIDETLALLTSPEFENNLIKAGEDFPQVYVSRARDAIPTEKLIDLLHLRDLTVPNLWWPKTYVVLTGESAARSTDRTGFGFNAARNAGAGPFPPDQGPTSEGEIELGRLHFARFTRGDIVEKSCALNTMAHEISHSLSDKPDQFWMHILDTGENGNPPKGMYEASYFIGTVAQCTYLESVGRIEAAGFGDCLITFSDPNSGSRFKSKACDDFPGDKPITPQGRINP